MASDASFWWPCAGCGERVDSNAEDTVVARVVEPEVEVEESYDPETFTYSKTERTTHSVALFHPSCFNEYDRRYVRMER
jgi:hypothetical protein